MSVRGPFRPVAPVTSFVCDVFTVCCHTEDTSSVLCVTEDIGFCFCLNSVSVWFCACKVLMVLHTAV